MYNLRILVIASKYLAPAEFNPCGLWAEKFAYCKVRKSYGYWKNLVLTILYLADSARYLQLLPCSQARIWFSTQTATRDGFAKVGENQRLSTGISAKPVIR